MITRAGATAALVWLQAACWIGPRADRDRLAMGPEGVRCDLRVSNVMTNVELLALQDTAAIVVRDRKVVVIPYRTVGSSNCNGSGIPFDPRTGRLVRELSEDLRLRSRFPQGLTPELLARIDSAYTYNIVERRLVTSRPAGWYSSPVMPLPDTGAVNALVTAAKRGTDRFRERGAAVVEGYRALGPDAPGMGQHWIHPGLIVAGRFDPERPQILNYVTVAGRPVLVGVAWAVPIDSGAPLPPNPAPASAWHFHGQSIDEESFVIDHHRAGVNQPGTRIAVLHAWIWAFNPAGIFAPDNWALPYARLGLVAPSLPDRGAARAISLATVGEPFYLRLISLLADPSPDATRQIAGRFQEHRELITDRAGARVDGLQSADYVWLASEWTRLWQEIRPHLTPSAWDRLAPAR